MTAKINSSTTLYEFNIFKLVTENVTLDNGETTDLHILRHPGAAAIVPLTDSNSVMMIKQYRHAVGGYIWEIPAGTRSPGEDALVCAKRELEEETGFAADSFQKLGDIVPVPGYSDERIHIFLATGLVQTQQNLDRDEVLDVHEIEFDHALQMISRGEINDSKTISGLFMAQQWFEQTKGAELK